ncbi:asparagine synthase (glutamine-hydrolyzing) [Brachybacterium rhamnosum]|uniref:asparagine synthase (glutamine-hydrolyzing) n=1 Tax=Brachybacterium rhamnosum TaxID=173361 RepID=A0ABW4PSD8_9MICO
MSGISGSHGSGADHDAIAARLGAALAAPAGGEAVDRSVPGGALTLVGPGIGGARSEAIGRVLLADGLTDAAAAALLDSLGDDLAGLDLTAIEQPYALALHDEATGTLLLARDGLGRAPLYWWTDAAQEHLLFASRIDALLDAGPVPARPDERTIHRFLLDGVADTDERTFVEGIHRLLPGQVLRHGPDGLSLSDAAPLAEELQGIAAAPGRPLDDAAVAEATSLLAASVRRATTAGDAIALTGDLGSLAVAAAAPEGVRAVAATRPSGSVPSAVTALHAARGRDMELITARDSQGDLLADLDELSTALGEPVPSARAHTALTLARSAREAGAGALVDGVGAEQLLPSSAAHQVSGLRRLRAGRRIGDLAQGALASRGALLGAARGALAPRAEVPTEALLANAFVASHRSERRAAPASLRAALVEEVLHGDLPVALRASRAAADHEGLRSASPLVDAGLLRLLASLDDASLLRAARDGSLLRSVLSGLAPGADLPARPEASVLDEHAWIVRHADDVRAILASESFAARPYVDARSVLAFFEDVAAHPEHHRSEQIWRLLSLELWLRAVIDPRTAAGTEEQAAPETAGEDLDPDAIDAAKADHEPNPGKRLDLVSETDGHTWRRLPLQTELVGRGDDLDAIVRERVERFAASVPAGTVPEGAPWYYVISEKIVAITQGRSWYTWEIHPRPSAKVLSRFVTRTPAGIGLGDPTTMELAIREVGLPRVLMASAAGAAGKLLRRRGVFYEVVGDNVRAIDGPTPYSAFPSNVSAKLPPKDPDVVAARLSAAIRAADIPAALRESFRGTVVMDANDIGRNVLGSDVSTPKADLEATFADNPLGQGRQRTPMAILVDRGEQPGDGTAPAPAAPRG